MIKTIVCALIGIFCGAFSGMVFIVLRADWRERKKRDDHNV